MAAAIDIDADSLRVGSVEPLFRLPASTDPGMRFVINRTPGNVQDAPVTLLLNWQALLKDR